MRINYNGQNIETTVHLPGSKSISNRWLILNEVLQTSIELKNLSTSKDTQDLIKAIRKIKEGNDKTIDIGHAGTDMRFLTALLSTITGEWLLTGSARMKERPIKELVSALRLIGAEIRYAGKEGFPPLEIKGKKLEGGELTINSEVSSQFISSLLLVAPCLKKELKINLSGNPVSWPYIQMTINILIQAGVKVDRNANSLSVIPTRGSALKAVEIEPDWSSASYWYSIAALSNSAEITLPGLSLPSSQGDSVLPDIYKMLGVHSKFEKNKLILSRIMRSSTYFKFDFTNCPDLAQTVAVTCLGLNMDCLLSGLSTLKHKETDRLLAMKTELEKFGADVSITNNSLQLKHKPETRNPKPEIRDITIETFRDHRMAMSFAPLALLFKNLTINDPRVVEKSYPEFWEHLKTAGISFS